MRHFELFSYKALTNPYHRAMDIFLDDITSLMLLRTSAQNGNLTSTPTDVTSPVPLGLSPVKLHRLGIPLLLSYLRVPEDRPLGLLVPSARNRLRTRGIKCHVCHGLPASLTFLQLHGNLVDDSDTRVFVEPPEAIVLGMAKRLRRYEINGTQTHQRSALMLVKLCLELCGTFRHDPFRPHDGDATYHVEPLTTTEQLAKLTEISSNDQGLRLVREAVPLVFDRSGSPQESFLGPALFYDESLGGLRLCEFLANRELELSHEQKSAIGGRRITPDFQLVGYSSVVEYLGAVHEQGDNPRIDHVRSLDYQTLGLREFCFNYGDVETQEVFMESAKRLVSVIEQFDGPGIRRRFQRLSHDEGFTERQKTLFEVFRPWLR